MEAPAPPRIKYWEDIVDAEDMEAMWKDASVSSEWINAGERMGERVFLSRDPDGDSFLTQTEMMALAGIVVHRHFTSQLDLDVISAVAEIESGRRPLALQCDRKTKEPKIGIMQLQQTTAKWLARELGYRKYDIEGKPALLYRPFVNVYFGAAYIKWLYSYDDRERSEEFVVRAFKGGVTKANDKSTLDYFQRYLSVRQSLPRRGKQIDENGFSMIDSTTASGSIPLPAEDAWAYWDSRTSPEDMEELWRHPDVLNEWTRSAERRGRVRFSQDKEKRPYLSRVELKAVAEIIISHHFCTRGVKPAVLASLAEICSMRFVNGLGRRTGLMGIDYPTASWLSNEVGYKKYKVRSVEDLYNPFASMYFGAAYLIWLSEYEGRLRTHQFVIQAYLGGPENVNLQETGPYWRKFQQILVYYNNSGRDQRSCSIL